MIKSTQDDNKAIYKVLTTIHNSNSFPKSDNEFDKYDLGDVVNLCNSRGYITGVHVTQNALGYYIYSGQPKLTSQGLIFIEQFNNQ